MRHALALDERRAWFKPTTWGQLDIDRKAAMTRVDPRDVLAYQSQDIREVWFAGFHSDVGVGNVSLRWMLGEAVNTRPGVLLNDSGVSLLRRPDALSSPEIHQSFNWAWWAVEQVPRLEIDNSGLYPETVRHRGSDGARDPEVSDGLGES
jgi:hypothetical protein